MYTNDFLDELLTCPKVVTEGIKSVPNRGGYYKKVFKMASQDGLYNFRGFFNQNLTFDEDFSFGLVYAPKEERRRIKIIRINGLHGGNKHIPHHAHCHEHRTDAEDINNGLDTERHIREVSDYTTYEQGLQYYVKRINLIKADRQKYFPPPPPIIPTLFDGLL